MNNLLDAELVAHKETFLLPKLGHRVVHVVVDYIIIFFIYAFIIIFIGHKRAAENNALLIFALTQFIYYTLLEFVFGITLGKLFTKSRVVRDDKSKPSFIQVFIRNAIRFVPIEFVMLFTPYSRCLHDVISKTWVIRINKEERLVKVNN